MEIIKKLQKIQLNKFLLFILACKLILLFNSGMHINFSIIYQ